MSFILDSRLKQDTIPICELGVCKLLLMNDRRYLWTILVPKIEGAIELHLLDAKTQSEIFHETMQIAKIIGEIEGVEKINIGALGNVVSQLHIHVIGRNASDSAWPAPVWGKGSSIPYQIDAAISLIEKINNQL